MWERFYQGIKEPKEMERVVGRLFARERALTTRFQRLQDELQDSYSEALRSEYLNVQTELMLLRENIEKAQARLKELKSLQKQSKK